MADKAGKLETLEEDAAELEEQISLLKGAIKVDSRQAKAHPVKMKALGDYAEERQLIAGDYAFQTRFSRLARVEEKTWDGLIADIGTHRITEQIRRQSNDISILLVEGWATVTHGGMIRTTAREYRHRPWSWVQNYLMSIQLGGTYIYYSPNEFSTPKLIISLFDYLNKQEHTALSQRQKLISMAPGLNPRQLTISSIPTVGVEMAKLLDAKFGSLQALCNASLEDLKIPGAIGDKKAQVIYKYVRNVI